MSNSRISSEGLAQYHHAPGKRSRVSGMQAFLLGSAMLCVAGVAAAYFVARFF